MQTEKTKSIQKPQTDTFVQRLDFYWQSIAIYAVVLLLYGLFKGSIEEGSFTITIKDPVVILLTIFIIVSAIGLLYNYYKKRTIIIGKDFIVFKTKFREKRYTLNDIVRINISKEKDLRLRKPFRIIKIRVKNRRRIIRIRPSSFWNERELMQAVVSLKKTLNK